jgi:hypothetical protein
MAVGGIFFESLDALLAGAHRPEAAEHLIGLTFSLAASVTTLVFLCGSPCRRRARAPEHLASSDCGGDALAYELLQGFLSSSSQASLCNLTGELAHRRT